MERARKRLYDYSKQPPAFIWDQIQNELNKEEVPVVRMSSRPKLIKYLFAAAAALLIIFVGKVFFSDRNPEKNSNVQLNAGVTDTKLINDSLQKNKQTLELIVQGKENTIAASPNKYLVISGPQGEPVKISKKAARLIVSLDGEYPPKPVWDKKIEEWKQVMLSNTATSSPTDLMSMLEEMN